jgi:hypothetical protein
VIKETKPFTGVNNLRQRAEQQLAQQSIASDIEVDATKLLHELQVHQIELEMQNEELLAAQTEAQASLERYTELYDMAPVSYLTLAHDATILQLNLKAAKQLGIFRSQLNSNAFQASSVRIPYRFLTTFCTAYLPTKSLRAAIWVFARSIKVQS